jgi:hypothetical protein
MKERTEKKLWDVAALFIIMLVVMLPVYSAQSFAAVNVQITKNQGQNGIEGYLDAEGDVWSVEAIISGDEAGEVNPEDVVLRIGGNEAQFESCSDSTLGTACEYISPLTDGVKEKNYDFLVVYKFLDALGYPDEKSNAALIQADGSAPTVTEMSFEQNIEDGNVDANFIVKDKFNGKPAIGIKIIEVIDADTNIVLKTLGPYEIGLGEFVYASDSGTGGKLSGNLFSGEGLKRIKVRAEDHLGHSQTSPAFTFPGDFVLPEISNLELVDFGKFIGPFNHPTDITVDIFEDNRLSSVKAYSDQADLSGEENKQNCVDDIETKGLYHCTWNDIEVSPESPISVKVIAKDEFGNTAETTLSASFTSDTKGPTVRFFGSERVYDSISYIGSGKQTIILEVNEEGAGILEFDYDNIVTGTKGIRANLGALGVSNPIKPKSCNETSYGAKCFWEADGEFESAGSAIITLSDFEDNVGNDGEADPVELRIDIRGPDVKKLGIYGGEKDYFESNDQINIKLQAVESSGLIVLANLNGIVPDAETTFPATIYMNEPGWQVFTQDDCEKLGEAEDAKWVCDLYTEKIMSGPEENLELELRVQDTAGNDASLWLDKDKVEAAKKVKNVEKFTVSSDGSVKLRFDLLGLANENDPDYWEVSKVVPLGGKAAFVDLDTTPLIYARMPFKIKLSSLKSKVRAIDIKVLGCVAAADQDPDYAVKTSALTAEPDPVVEDTTSDPEGTASDTAAVATGVAVATGMAADTDIETSSGPTSPTVSRALIYGGINHQGDPSPSPELVLEFQPFDGREMFNLAEVEKDDFEKKEVEFLCKLQIFSKVGDISIGTGELQDVTVMVPFGFTDLGAQDENLAKEIKRARDEASTGFYGVIGKLEKVMKWVYYIAQLANQIATIWGLIEGAKGSIEGLYKTVVKDVGVAGCFGFSAAAETTKNSAQMLSIPIGILSCRPTKVSWMRWYDEYLGMLPKYYNQLLDIEVLKGPGGCTSEVGDTKQGGCPYKPARSVRDNIYLSYAGACLPGIIHNMDKLRQIKCRKVMCLENEVAAGLTTVGACNELHGLLLCKYFIGELWYILPFSQFYDKVVGVLQNAVRDPIAVAHTATYVTCTILCFTSSAGSSGCAYVKFGWELIDWVSGMIGFVTTIVQDIKSGGLQYCDSVGL